MGKGLGGSGANGTISGKACPKGLYGTFCEVYIYKYIFQFPNSVIFSHIMLSLGFYSQVYFVNAWYQIEGIRGSTMYIKYLLISRDNFRLSYL